MRGLWKRGTYWGVFRKFIILLTVTTRGARLVAVSCCEARSWIPTPSRASGFVFRRGLRSLASSAPRRSRRPSPNTLQLALGSANSRLALRPGLKPTGSPLPFSLGVWVPGAGRRASGLNHSSPHQASAEFFLQQRSLLGEFRLMMIMMMMINVSYIRTSGKHPNTIPSSITLSTQAA